MQPTIWSGYIVKIPLAHCTDANHKRYLKWIKNLRNFLILSIMQQIIFYICEDSTWEQYIAIHIRHFPSLPKKPSCIVIQTL